MYVLTKTREQIINKGKMAPREWANQQRRGERDSQDDGDGKTQGSAWGVRGQTGASPDLSEKSKSRGRCQQGKPRTNRFTGVAAQRRVSLCYSAEASGNELMIAPQRRKPKSKASSNQRKIKSYLGTCRLGTPQGYALINIYRQVIKQTLNADLKKTWSSHNEKMKKRAVCGIKYLSQSLEQ